MTLVTRRVCRCGAECSAARSRLSKPVGAPVKQNDIIGYVGHTGVGTGAHLHFEVRVGPLPSSPAVNAMGYLQGASSPTGGELTPVSQPAGCADPGASVEVTDAGSFVGGELAWPMTGGGVSRGAQKNFTTFMANLARRNLTADRELYQQLIAKALLWKRTERLVAQQSFGGYRANLVAYSIAKLSHATAQRIDLRRIWETQALTPATETALIALSHLAWRNLVDEAPPGVNITEWAKREDCWKQMRAAQTDVATLLVAELVSPTGPGEAATVDAAETNADAARVIALGAAGWVALSEWSRQTASLADWQRKLAADVARRLASGRRPTPRQTEFALAILAEAQRLGFAAEPPAL